MTPAERVLALFDRISEAPDAIPRLRRFVLDLAVRGRLVEQGPNDSPSEELIKLIQNSGVKQDNLPGGWRQATVGTLLDFRYGKSLKASDRADEGQVPVYGSNGVIGFTSKPLTCRPSLIIGRKGSAGALNICRGPSWTTDVAYFVETPPFLEISYLFNALSTLDLDRLGKGVKPGLSRSDAYALNLSVPPLTEQRRIVAKVDELMALCDRLERTQKEREHKRHRLVIASLGRLKQPNNTTAFGEHARFHLQHLARTMTNREHIEQFRQTILALAIRGLLLRQDPRNASDVNVFNGGDVATTSSIALEPTLPIGWKIATLESIAETIVDCPHSTPRWTTVGKLCVRTNQFRPGWLDLSNSRFVSEATYRQRIARLTPMENDILYSREGGILGVACRVPPGIELCLGQRMMLIRPGLTTRPDYLELVLNSPFITAIAKERTTGGAAPRINVSTVKTYPIPVPPLCEQKRIVAKVDELTGICDRLEEKLDAGRTAQAALLEATLREALKDGVRAVSRETVLRRA